jgi:plastocyanin
MAFTPGSLSVSVGTTVKWTNNDGVTHTVTANDGSSFDSGPIAAGASFSFKFMTAGTFNYHCTIHSGMTGTIVVTP